MDEYTRYVGLDVHKAFIAIAVATAGRSKPEYLGRIENTPDAVGSWVRRRARAWGPLTDTLMCYEAGPCGYTLYRDLSARGLECQVIAPAMTPQKPGDRVRTDRRDALHLAGMLRAGELTPIWVPDETHEAFRGLIRARESAVRNRSRGRHQLNMFLLAKGIRRPEGTKPWSQAHERWLSQLEWSRPSERMIFSEQRHAILESQNRVTRLEQCIDELMATSPWRRAAEALQCLRGVAKVTAATLCAELGPVARFSRPPRLMSYVGLVPGEKSSGGREYRYSVTKAGNSHVRRVTVEAAWHYRHHPYVSQTLRKRQEGQPAEVVAIAWRAQQRLNKRYRSLLARGKEKNRVVVAIARELLGFVWEILLAIDPPETEMRAG